MVQVVKKQPKRDAKRAAIAKHIQDQYLGKNRKRLRRNRAAPSRFSPCTNTNTYNRPWAPFVVGTQCGVISFTQSQGGNSNPDVEKLGEQGAKWWLCNKLHKTIEDGDDVKAGYFITSNGPGVFDAVYKDPVTNDVYVMEAKATKAKAQANLITRQSGNTQGTFPYLDEVANEMAGSGDAEKNNIAKMIQNAPPGKLHYVVVHTTYSNVNGKVTANQPVPKSIINR